MINTISYQLDWKNNREVTISKKERSVVPLDTQEPYIPAEDTLFTLQENWHFTHDEWEYAWIYECRAEKYITERYLKGQIGEVAYFTRKVDQNLAIGGEFRKTYMYNQISETTTDVKNNLYKEIESSDDNPEKVMRVIRTKRIAIRPEVERKKPKPLKKQEEENEGE